MDVDYIKSKLSLLPRFRAQRLEAQSGEHEGLVKLYGSFSEHIGVEDQSTYFYLSDLRSIYGLLLASHGEEQLRCFEQFWVSDIERGELLASELYYFAAYDGRQVQLAINPEIIWREVVFAATEALSSHFSGTDGKSYRKLSQHKEGDSVPAGSTTVEGGWDHEHCTFCDRKIKPDDTAFVSNHDIWGDGWACNWCYRNAVEPKDPRPLLINFEDRV